MFVCAIQQSEKSQEGGAVRDGVTMSPLPRSVCGVRTSKPDKDRPWRAGEPACTGPDVARRGIAEVMRRQRKALLWYYALYSSGGRRLPQCPLVSSGSSAVIFPRSFHVLAYVAIGIRNGFDMCTR